MKNGGPNQKVVAQAGYKVKSSRLLCNAYGQDQHSAHEIKPQGCCANGIH